MEVVSTDRESLKTRIKQRELTKLVGRVIPQRLFTPEDVIQIEILNSIGVDSTASSHIIQIKPVELPLNEGSKYKHWV